MTGIPQFTFVHVSVVSPIIDGLLRQTRDLIIKIYKFREDFGEKL